MVGSSGGVPERRILRPLDAANAELAAIMAEMERAGENALHTLLPLTADDNRIVGVVVQTFAYCDLNARRALEIIDHLEGAAEPTVKHSPRDNEVLPLLAERSGALPISDAERAELALAINMLRQFSPIRHHFAHWAARRHPRYDALIAMTTNSREAARRAQHQPERFKASFGVIPMPEVRANLPIIETNANYIASRVRDWWLRFMPAD